MLKNKRVLTAVVVVVVFAAVGVYFLSSADAATWIRR